MMTTAPLHSPIRTLIAGTLALCLVGAAGFSSAFADGEDVGGVANVNTGALDSPNGSNVIGNDNAVCDQTGVCVNGSNSGNLNNNQNANAVTSSNSNQNVLNPVLYSPTSSNGGGGGNSALVLPRNPLALPNANYGRSNFGLQFGVNNNPALSALTGNSNALGWFLQGGVTIPFGKIPDVLKNSSNAKLDELRMDRQDASRRVFGNVGPTASANRGTVHVNKSVQGAIYGLDAHNYTTVPSAKLSVPGTLTSMMSAQTPLAASSAKGVEPKVLALAEAHVFSHPLNTGDDIGSVEVGHEYPYLGHTKSGWVKILLPNGKTGWTSTNWEYIKLDYTQVDDLAVDPAARTTQTALNAPETAKPAVVKSTPRTGARRRSTYSKSRYRKAG
ncbi:MAG: SH3 domain-containing protein [Candidatus Melainabacteria bacterium]